MNTSNTLTDDPAERRRIDAGFIADFRAGRIPDLNTTPFDPKSDPFGTDYAWLNAPERPFDAAVGSLIALPVADWYHVGGPGLRAVALSGSMASGTDEQICRRWAETQFVAMCLADGEDGQELLLTIRTERVAAPDTLHRVAAVIDKNPHFAGLSLDQRAAAVLIIISALQPEAS